MKVQELDGDEWLDESLLSAEEKAMLEARIRLIRRRRRGEHATRRGR